MSQLGFRKVAVYSDEACLGELNMVPVGEENFQFPNNEIRLHRISAVSERCHPLAVLHTISAPVRCKLEPSLNSTTDQSDQLIKLHSSCFNESKTAVVTVGNEELHLVAMPSKLNKLPCFWCYSVPAGMYQSCLEMLNLRCLAIVFDLDETLVVANTVKSFEERIEGLRSQISWESDPIRSSGMIAEMNRYIEDRSLLKQYVESDSVVDNGEVYKAKPEFTSQERGFRPVIRLSKKNLVLTRIIPENRDTSVLVRLRPGWEDLKSYLTANGRKRFEVFVCTMAQKEYALETWRLLDPDATLISLNQRMKRIVSVKHTAKKSLLHVFQEGDCHPRMAMVVDDRVNVWEDKDQPRVHAVPAFAPHYAPRAETETAFPVLTMVRNVACDVRGRFFREFDESLLHKISEVRYEDDAVSLLASPDVSNYMVSNFVPNGVVNPQLPVGVVVPKAFENPSLAGSQNELPATMNEHQTGETLKSIPSVAIYALNQIGKKCDSKVEFKRVARRSDCDLEFSFEAWFGGEMLGFGAGNTMEDAQLLAADKALRALTDKLSHNQKESLYKMCTEKTQAPVPVAKADLVEASSGSEPKKQHVKKARNLGAEGGILKKNFKGKCYNCNNNGHKSSECRKPKRTKNDLNLVEDVVTNDINHFNLCPVVFSQVNLVDSNTKESGCIAAPDPPVG